MKTKNTRENLDEGGGVTLCCQRHTEPIAPFSMRQLRRIATIPFALVAGALGRISSEEGLVTPAHPKNQGVGNVAGMQVEIVWRAVVGFEHCQVLRAEMRVRFLPGQDRKDFLPGLPANYAMAQRSNPAPPKPANRKSLSGLPN